MGDGEYHATRDGLRASGPDDTPMTPGPHPTPGAAPWERFSIPADDSGLHRWHAEPPTEPADDRSGKGGSHVEGGVSVADLIAKLGAAMPQQPTPHRVATDAEPSDDDSEDDLALASPDSADVVSDAADDLSDDADDQLDTQVIPAYSFQLLSELPNLDELTRDKHGWDALEFDSEAEPAETADAPTQPNKTKSRRHHPMLLAGRSLAALFAVLALVLTGGAWQWSTSKNSHLNTVSALDPDSADIVDPGGQYGDENFLVVGLDSRAGGNANMGAGDADDAGGARSDSVILVNIPASRKRVVAVSFPRDLAITPLQCEAWNPDTGKYGPITDPKTGITGSRMIYTETKLNSAFSFGGPKCLVKEIQKLSGLNINRFIAIDFVGFARMVEALGGVEVCTKTPLRDYELGTVLEHAGRQIIDGPTALNYVRARQVTTEVNGDYGRIKRQQLFLSSLLRSLISEDTLLNLNKLNNVVNMFIDNSYVDNVRTKDLVELGQSLQHMAAGHVTFVTAPTGVTDQNGDEPPRTGDMKALFSAIINDEPLPGENDANAQNLGSVKTTPPSTKKPSPTNPAPESHPEQVTTTSPQDVTVQVYNGTAQSGLASAATNQLKRNGFNVMSPNDYPNSLTTTTVFFSPGNEQAAATVASSFTNVKVERVAGMGQVVQLVLGPDFSSVSTPAPSGSSMSVQIGRNSSGAPTKLPEDLTVTNAADTSCE
jgi:LCP family protein required for cell wall assembly